MTNFKLQVFGILMCIAVISDQSYGVLNKSTSKNVNDSKDDKKSEKSAEERLGSEYGVPRPSFNGPAPVYGPPELTGNYAPVQVYPPPPPELPPPPPRPISSYGPPRKPPQLQFNSRPLKLAPWKLSPPSSRFPTKPSGHGPPIPISLEAYGPPINLSPPSFALPQNDYGPPLLPAVPQPGVAAPPTPPDIKYDGWQPIAGHVEPNIQHLQSPPAVQHLPPPPVALDHTASVNLPSNSYGEPINNPEDHNLKQSVGHSDQGLPPPVLPESEPLHNIQDAAKSLPPHSNSLEALPTATSSLISSFSADLSSGYDGSGHGSQDFLSIQQLPALTSSVSDSYGAPPATSFSSTGPYSPSGFGGFRQSHHAFSHSASFHHPRSHSPFRSHGLPSSLIPPRSRAPTRFRDSVPSGVFNSINRYLPPPVHHPGPSRPAGNYGPPRLSLQQQLPVLSKPVSFNFNSFSGFGAEKSPLAAPNANYGTPLSFTDFNTPAPILTYGAPNFGPATSFISSSRGNLYDQHTSLSTSYGRPLAAPEVFNDCGREKSIDSIQLTSFAQSHATSDSSVGDYAVPSINELDLEPGHSSEHKVEVKDSYGNPTGGDYDQRSSSSVELNSQTVVHGATAEALTQGRYEGNSVAPTGTTSVDQLAQLAGDSEPVLALAQTLSAEGASADGFQIQGSKGTYTLQIQSANGLHHNSDGTIRHDQLLSDGLLQDILAAIEEPGERGKNQFIEIQGMPQAQQLAEVHQKGYGHEQEHDHNDLSSAAASSIVTATSASNENIALFFNNTFDEESRKEVRSTASSEASAENSMKASEEKSKES